MQILQHRLRPSLKEIALILLLCVFLGGCATRTHDSSDPEVQQEAIEPEEMWKEPAPDVPGRE